MHAEKLLLKLHSHEKEDMSVPITIRQKEFGELYKSNYSKLFYCALDIVENEEWAKDIVGEVFSKAWTAYEKLRDTDVASYLYISVRNRSIDHVRRQHAMRGYHKVFLEIEREWHDHHTNETEDDLRYMHQVISELPERQKHIFHQCFLDGKRYVDVAKEMQLSESSIHKYMVKSFAFIRERFKKRKIE